MEINESLVQKGDISHNLRIIKDPDRQVSKYPDRLQGIDAYFYEKVDVAEHLIVLGPNGLQYQNNYFIAKLCDYDYANFSYGTDEKIKKINDLLDPQKEEFLFANKDKRENNTHLYLLSPNAAKKLITLVDNFSAEEIKEFEKIVKLQANQKSTIIYENDGNNNHEYINNLKIKYAAELNKIFEGENTDQELDKLEQGFLRHEENHFRQQIENFASDPEKNLIEIDLNEMEHKIKKIKEKDRSENFSQSVEFENFEKDINQLSIVSEIKAMIAEINENDNNQTFSKQNIIYRFSKLLPKFNFDNTFALQSNFEYIINHTSKTGKYGFEGPYIAAMIILITQNTNLLMAHETGEKINIKELGTNILTNLNEILINPQPFCQKIFNQEFLQEIDFLFQRKIDNLRNSYIKLMDKAKSENLI